MRRGWTTGLEHNGLRTLRLERGIQTSGGDHKAPSCAFAFERRLDVNAAVSVSRSGGNRIGHPRAAAAHGPFRFTTQDLRLRSELARNLTESSCQPAVYTGGSSSRML